MTLLRKILPLLPLGAVALSPGLALGGQGCGAVWSGCRDVRFGSGEYIVCHYDLRRFRVGMRLRDGRGAPYGSVRAFVRGQSGAKGERLVFAMNGGMYHAGLSPVGYYVENGVRLARANTRKGPGNFHLLPNGVFFAGGGRAGVMETRAFLKSGMRPRQATQSGPMLVINGRIHPAFIAASDSRKIRNGVGVPADGRGVWFALSTQPVNFHTFARLFRDCLKTPNALFLDGTISQLWSPQRRWLSFYPAGPIIAVTRRGG